MREKALHYKKMMEQKYKKAGEQKETTTIEQESPTPIHEARALKREETQEDLTFKLNMSKKYVLLI